ncbi:MAG: ATPase [Deltaproteobacteria bacterium]|nr:ATPase [Deltaproteobacteria bacterium]MCB9786265.1 ATPase [Deltaproteobacteria bacterium]
MSGDTHRGPRRGVIGLDAGGTKTDGALATLDGHVVARARGGPGNYQSIGVEAAGRVYSRVIGELLERADAEGVQVEAAAFGLAGHDRPKDALVLDELIAELLPSVAARVVVNDTFLVLRAGSPQGHGVAVVSGTGSNCCGVAPDGRDTRIGGLGWEFGDGAGAGDLGVEAVRAAFRGEDGRGAPTRLSALIRLRFKLDRLDDLVDYHLADAPAPAPPAGLLAPLVFEAACAGDAVSIGILEAAGRELALSAVRVAERLFTPADSFPLVLGGSVLQLGGHDAMRVALIDAVHARFPGANPVVLEASPLAGALLLALDRVLRPARPAPDAGARVTATLATPRRPALAGALETP